MLKTQNKAKQFEHSNKVLIDITKDVKKSWTDSTLSDSNTTKSKESDIKAESPE